MVFDFDESGFREKVCTSLELCKHLLDRSKQVNTLNFVQHEYVDKYRIVEALVGISLLAQINCLSELGLDSDLLSKSLAWSKNSQITLCFEICATCEFVKEVVRFEESPGQRLEFAGFQIPLLFSSSTKTRISEFVFQYSVKFHMFIMKGVGDIPENRVTILRRSTQQEIICPVKYISFPLRHTDVWKVDLTWFFQHVDFHSESHQPYPISSSSSLFHIDRGNPQCYTPSRNDDIKAALHSMNKISSWCLKTASCLQDLLSVQQSSSTFSLFGEKLDTSLLSTEGIFMPVFPLCEEEKDVRNVGTSSRRLLEASSLLHLSVEEEEEEEETQDTKDT